MQSSGSVETEAKRGYILPIFVTFSRRRLQKTNDLKPLRFDVAYLFCNILLQAYFWRPRAATTIMLSGAYAPRHPAPKKSLCLPKNLIRSLIAKH
jgi:hypothetical protein